jgi:hypothetical protein
MQITFLRNSLNERTLQNRHHFHSGVDAIKKSVGHTFYIASHKDTALFVHGEPQFPYFHS